VLRVFIIVVVSRSGLIVVSKQGMPQVRQQLGSHSGRDVPVPPNVSLEPALVSHVLLLKRVVQFIDLANAVLPGASGSLRVVRVGRTSHVLQPNAIEEP
jgi:hypothetical protein